MSCSTVFILVVEFSECAISGDTKLGFVGEGVQILVLMFTLPAFWGLVNAAQGSTFSHSLSCHPNLK